MYGTLKIEIKIFEKEKEKNKTQLAVTEVFIVHKNCVKIYFYPISIHIKLPVYL